MAETITPVSLRQETEERYLTYAMSVITSRALPDVRDGLEPVVLPAQFPNLLVNGTSGIAVGVATNIPPHNLGEVCRALALLIDNPDATTAQLMEKIKGPDFPLGGRVITDKATLRQIYETG